MKRITKLIVLLTVALNCGFAQISIEYVKKTKTYGIKNVKTRQWLTQPVYKNISEVSSLSGEITAIRYYIANTGKKMFFILANGSTSISPQFDEIISSSNPELFVVKNKNVYCFFNPGSGILKGPGNFTSYNNPENNMNLYIIKKGEKYMMVDIKKQGVCSPEYDQIIGILSDSAFAVKKNNKCGVVNFSGDQKLDFIYDSIVFTSLRTIDEFIELRKDKKWGLADLSYKQIINCKYEIFDLKFLRNFSDSFPQKCFPAKLNSKWGMVSLTGQQIIPHEYDSVLDLRRDKRLTVVKNTKMGLIDLNNKILFPFLYDYFESENDNYVNESKEKNYFVCNKGANGKFKGQSLGMADSTGKILLPMNANSIPIFQTYNYRIPENFDKFDGRKDSTLVGYLWNIGGILKNEIQSTETFQESVFDEQGNERIDDVVRTFKVWTIKGGKTGIAGKDGKMIVPTVYDDMIFFFSRNDDRGDVRSSISNAPGIPSNNETDYLVNTSQPIIAKKDGKWGTIAWSGKEIIPCIYDSIFYEYTSSMLDANDSVFAARNYPKYFYKVYKNALHGYISTKGKILMPAEIERDVCDITISSIDSIVNPAYYPYHDHVTYTKILANNVKEKPYIICKQGYVHSPETGENETGPVTVEFNYIEKAKFSFQNNNTVQFMAPSKAEDVILLDKNLTPYLLSSLKGQLTISGNAKGVLGFDSILDKASGKRVFKEMYVRGSEEELFFIDHMFAKYDGKWYLQNITGVLLNNGQPFDSVEIVDKQKYKAWRQGKFIYYGYKYKGPFDREMDQEYPDKPFAERISCRNCKYTMKKYPRQTILEQFNAEGNQIRDSIIPYTFDIPVMQKGTYNIIDTTNKLLLKIWADEMILPPVNGYNFNMADSTSGIYDEKNFNKPGYPFFGTHKKSIALKYAQTWRLTTVQKQDVFIDGFTEVKIEGDNWVVKKKKKVLYYSIDGLKKVKKE